MYNFVCCGVLMNKEVLQLQPKTATIKQMSEKKRSAPDRSKDRHSKDYRAVRFPLDLYEAIEAIALANDRPTSWEFRRAIEQYIEQYRKLQKEE